MRYPGLWYWNYNISHYLEIKVFDTWVYGAQLGVCGTFIIKVDLYTKTFQILKVILGKSKETNIVGN